MTVDQLRRSVDHLFGGESWTLRTQNRDFDLFEELARTLGAADYVEVTEPVVEPSPLFQKFMDDLSAQLCSKAVQRDGQANDASDKLIVRYPDDVDANLRFLRLKFHGVYIAEDTPPNGDELEAYRTLFSDIATDSNTGTAWVGVCMAMLTAPEFIAY